MSISPLPRTSFDDCAGVVVCGGFSSRMGTDKAHLPIGPESMLQRIVRTIASVVSPVIVVAARDQSVPPCDGNVIVVRDKQPNRGPLEGIRVGLESLPPNQDYAFVSGCDAPLLKESVIAQLLSMRAGYNLVLPRDGDDWYPLTAVYHRGTLSVIDELMRNGEHGPIELVRLVRTLAVDVECLRRVDPHLESLQNVNSPLDYQRIVRTTDGPG